jgi:hypothetical protein
VNTKFLDLQIDNHINWNHYVEEMIPELSGACYAVRSVVHISNINTLKSIYYANFHYFIKYGILLWGNPSISWKIFTLQKKIVRIMANANQKPLVKVYLNN